MLVSKEEMESKRNFRRMNTWYRGKVTRMEQLKQLRDRKDWRTYRWLKDYWRNELEGNS